MKTGRLKTAEIVTDEVNENTTDEGVLFRLGQARHPNGVLVNTITELDTDTGVTVEGVLLKDNGLTAPGNLTVDGGAVINEDGGATGDFRVEGDTDANLIFADASADTVGIGTQPAAGGGKLQFDQNSSAATESTEISFASGDVGKSFVKSTSNGSVDQTADVIGFINGSQAGGLMIVSGFDNTNSAKRFSDILHVQNGASVSVINQSGAGSAASRTYSASGSQIKLEMGGSTAYSVRTLLFSVNANA